MKKKRGLVVLLLGVLLLVGVPLAGSLIGLRGSVERAFERHWGRPVEISRAEVRLLPEPSLRAYGVKLVEWEEFGTEPFMHVEEARCRVKLAGLLRGRLECARLHFLRPSLNVVRNHEGAWNLLRWLEGAGEVWPVLTAEEARINFKQGAEKKVYALAEARFALEAKPEAWHIDLEARPFRSDRRLRETGRIRLNGTWKRTPDETGSSPLALSWEVERSALSQWVAFFTGHEPPVRANVALTGNVTGSVAALRLAGECTVEDLRRWDLIPPRPVPRWRGSYELRFSPMTRELGILRADLRSEGSSISARGRIENLLAEPRWDVEVTSSLALDELLAQLGALRTGVSPDTRLQGTTEVTATLAGTTSEWKGTMTLAKPALWRLPGIREAVRVEPTEMHWQGDRVDLDPLRLVFPGERTLELGGRLLLHEPNWFARVRAHTQQMDLEHLRAAARAVGWNLWGETQWRGRAKLALEWRGNVGAWSERMRRGRLELEQASLQAPALNGSLEIEKASVTYTGRALRVEPMTVRFRGTTLSGTLIRLRPQAPWKVNFSIDRLRLDDLDALLNPARGRSLLATLIGPRRPLTAAWDGLEAWGHAEGQSLEAGPLPLSRLHTDFHLKERQLVLSRLRFRSFGGRIRGRIEADFRVRPPAYRLAGNVKQMDLARLLQGSTSLGGLFSGTLGADVVLQTAGYRAVELRRNVQGTVAGVVTDATLSHINLLAAMRKAANSLPEESDGKAGTQLESLAAEFQVANGRVRCQSARVVVEQTALELAGEVGFDGRLNLRVRGEPLLVADVEPSPAHRQLFTSAFEILGTLRQPVVRVKPEEQP